jgi:hypothetical protein
MADTADAIVAHSADWHYKPPVDYVTHEAGPVEAAADDLREATIAWEQALLRHREAEAELATATTAYELAFEHFRSAVSQAQQKENR